MIIGVLRALALSTNKEPARSLCIWYYFNVSISRNSKFQVIWCLTGQRNIFLTKCTKLRIFGKRILVIFGRAPSPRKWIHWAANELKYFENFSKSISWAQNRVFVWCDSNRAKFTRRCQTCSAVFFHAWGRKKKVALLETEAKKIVNVWTVCRCKEVAVSGGTECNVTLQFRFY